MLVGFGLWRRLWSVFEELHSRIGTIRQEVVQSIVHISPTIGFQSGRRTRLFLGCPALWPKKGMHDLSTYPIPCIHFCLVRRLRFTDNYSTFRALRKHFKSPQTISPTLTLLKHPYPNPNSNPCEKPKTFHKIEDFFRLSGSSFDDIHYDTQHDAQ